MADEQQSPRLRPAHVFASSLAAVTGAFLASRLGVYGTVIGVGVISLFTTLGTDVYLRSLERTRQMTARSRARTIELPGNNPAAETADLPQATETVALPRVAETAEVSEPFEPAEQTRTARPAADDEPTVAVPGLPADADRTNGESTAMLPVAGHDDAAGRDGDPAADSAPRRWTRARISLVLAGALASFVLALLVITGIESVSGSSLSGGGRTTLSELGGNVGSTDPGPDSEEVDEPGQPVPTPEPDRPSPVPTDPLDGDDRDVTVPPAEELPDPEIPAEPDTTSPSPTESPTPEPTDQLPEEDVGGFSDLQDDPDT